MQPGYMIRLVIFNECQCYCSFAELPIMLLEPLCEAFPVFTLALTGFPFAVEPVV